MTRPNIVLPQDIRPLSGTFTDSGLSIAGLISKVSINETTWTALPLTPQTDRNTLCIQNRSGQGMYINFTGSDVDATLKGWYIPNNGVQNLKLTDSIIVYGKSETSTVDILVKELS
jgi:hypothetical protein